MDIRKLIPESEQIKLLIRSINELEVEKNEMLANKKLNAATKVRKEQRLFKKKLFSLLEKSYHIEFVNKNHVRFYKE